MRNIYPESAPRKREKENRMKRTVFSITLHLTAMGLLALATVLPPVQAETIVIGKGSGVVWEGMPFSHTLEGPMTSSLHFTTSLFGVSSTTYACNVPAPLAIINGVRSFQIAPGVGFVPRLSVDGFFTRYDNSTAHFGGTIGLPATEVRMDNGQSMQKSVGAWCFSPLGSAENVLNYYSTTGPRQVNFNGNWAIITDGTQTSQDNITIPTYYFATYSYAGRGDYFAQALPTVLNLRISTLECIVDTPTQIDFGSVPYIIQAGTELAMKSNPLSTQCNQDAGASINANINVQLRSLSGHHGSNPRYLALNEGGGYITGEINNGITGSGACNLSTGVVFDGTLMPIGAVTTAQTGTNFINEITWRLCSGGNDLPTGRVTASAELLVTFN